MNVFICVFQVLFLSTFFSLEAVGQKFECVDRDDILTCRDWIDHLRAENARLMNELNDERKYSEILEKRLDKRMAEERDRLKAQAGKNLNANEKKVVNAETGFVKHALDDQYYIYKVDLLKDNLQLAWYNRNTGRPYGSVGDLKRYVEGTGRQLIFAMNAGIFEHRLRKPKGLYIERKKEYQSLDIRKETDVIANFYMQPNGVFFIDTDNSAHIMTTDDFGRGSLPEIEYATQSGPMLLVNKKINDKFDSKSRNFHKRNGVCLTKDETAVYFVMSKDPVRFYDLSWVMKDFGCINGLYLDGALSSIYTEAVQDGPLAGLGPLFVVMR